MKHALGAALVALAGCHSRLDLGRNAPAAAGGLDGGAGSAGLAAGGGGSNSGGAGSGAGGAGGALGDAGSDVSDGGDAPGTVGIALGGSTSAAWLAEATGFWGLADRGQIRVAPAEAHDVCNGRPCQPLVLHGSISELSRIELGARHGCSLSFAGTVACWGDDAFGQLARDIATPDPHPAALDVALEAVTTLALGRFHGCALVGPRVWCWGLGEHGQLGAHPDALETCGVPADFAALIPGSPSSVRCSPRPLEVPALEGAVDLFAGGFGTCALFAGGGARCMGLNDRGQLGLGAAALGLVTTPTDFPGSGVLELALGERHGCAVLSNGTARCFGENPLGELGVGTLAPSDCAGTPCFHTPVPVSDLNQVTRIAVGANHSCALLRSGATRCWGSDALEQLGNSSTQVETCATPAGDRPCSRVPVAPYSLEDAVDLRAGDTHTCAVRSSGEVSCWGDNSLGQLGYLRLEPVTFPSPVYNLFPGPP